MNLYVHILKLVYLIMILWTFSQSLIGIPLVTKKQ